MANRQKFTRAVRSEIAERAKSPIGEPACELCGAVGVKLEVHHLRQDAMKRPERKRKPLTASDGLFICRPCHVAISAEQAVVFNKMERVREKHNGVEIAVRRKIPARKFRSAPAKDRTVTKVARGRSAFERQIQTIEE
jgi:hypothetical protein